MSSRKCAHKQKARAKMNSGPFLSFRARLTSRHKSKGQGQTKTENNKEDTEECGDGEHDFDVTLR